MGVMRQHRSEVHMSDLTGRQSLSPEQAYRQRIVLELGLQDLDGVVRGPRTAMLRLTAVDMSPLAFADQLKQLPIPDRIRSNCARKATSRRLGNV